MTRLAPILAAAAVAFAATPALAQADLFSPEVFDGVADLRLAAATGETSWTDFGYGKIRYSGAGGDVKITPQLAEAALVWKPRFTWALSGHLHLQHQPEQENDVDIVEAFLNWKPTPKTAWRYGARLGLFYPPISQEHDDAAWGVTNTITPSAINSWVGEEVKVIALEAKVGRALSNGAEIGVTAAIFDHNDTSGTLLSLRGWALHDLQSTAYGGQPSRPCCRAIAASGADRPSTPSRCWSSTTASAPTSAPTGAPAARPTSTSSTTTTPATGRR